MRKLTWLGSDARTVAVCAITSVVAWSVVACGGGSNSSARVSSAGDSGSETTPPNGGSSGKNAGGSSGSGGAGSAKGGTSSTGGSSGTGGKSAGGMSGGGTSNGGSGGGPVTVTKTCTGSNGTCNTTLPSGAPSLTAGTWANIGPTGVPFGGGNSATFTQGIAMDPCNASTLYLCVDGFDTAASKAGLYKSTDAGSSWNLVGAISSSTATNLDEPIRVRIDPKNSQHLYVVDGVRGNSEGFWVSCDGGNTFYTPDGFANLQTTQGLFQLDTYDAAVDPTDFNHVLVTSHSAWGWTDTKWNTASGVLESKDGGNTWTAHAPSASSWGTGHAIAFLYNPALNIGDANTWLLSTQGGTRYRTTDAGNTWTEVSSAGGIEHGGGTIYYDSKGVLYASGYPSNQRSTDNGVTWTAIGSGSSGFTAILGDGTTLYTAPTFGPTAFYTSPESDGTNFTAFNSQMFDQGPFELVYDSANKILYSGTWQAGMWALKVK